ncbi:carbohydrate ABC transporter permease [Shewanella sp.]|uniref:carbohydrate ABC transporter permease n=1 Tax=Shewanella sp. TaxID=50422 RepID=UPI0025EF3671|nr:sugar ABC transporter permease [Shewanella sp.]
MKLFDRVTEAQVGAAIAIGFLLYNLVFWAYPFLWLAILSLSDWRFFGTPSYAGLDNLFFILQDPEFWNSMWNVARFLLLYIPIVLTCSLAFAFGLQFIGRGKAFIALCFLLANISSGVAYSLVFTKIYSSTGPLNSFLFEYFGFKIPWLTSPTFAMLAITLVVTWKFVGYYGLILYSGLLAIPKEIYDAATLDNASGFKRLFKITLPMLNAQIIMVLVFAITVGFGIFTEPFMMTGGGPLDSTNMPQIVMYETAFKRLEPSRAALMAIIIATASYLLIKLVRKIFEKNVEIV